MKIYGNSLSPNVKRVRVAAKELGLDAELIEMDFASGAMRAPDYLAKNPMGKVPTLEDDGHVIWESGAILYYLASKHGKLLPNDLLGRTETLRWMFWNASHYGAAISGITFENIVKPKLMNQQPDPARVAAEQQQLARFAPVLNAHLEGKTWVNGGDFSIADIMLGTTTEIGSFAGFDLAPYPHIAAWLKRVQARPSWK